MSRVSPKNTGFDKFSFFFKIIRIRKSQQKEKKKKEKIRNDDKKMKQIRIDVKNANIHHFLIIIFDHYKTKILKKVKSVKNLKSNKTISKI